jgi:hypothetical protein
MDEKKIGPLKTNFSPPVPQIINKIPHDDDAALFWVTKHGIRMTGMPAWTGVLSDDEIWGDCHLLSQELGWL